MEFLLFFHKRLCTVPFGICLLLGEGGFFDLFRFFFHFLFRILLDVNEPLDP